MKHISLLVTMIVSITLVVGRPAQSQVDMPGADPSEAAVRLRDATASALVRLIDLRLNPGITLDLSAKKAGAVEKESGSWSVSLQPQFNTITIRRDQPVLIENSFRSINANPSAPRKAPTLQNPEFSFLVEPFLSPEDYARLQAENKIIQKQLFEMGTHMRHISHKFDQYLPENEAEKMQVQTYNKLRRTMHSNLPDLYFRNISLSWTNSFGISTRLVGFTPWSVAEIHPDETEIWRREKAEVTQAVLRLLARYEPENK